MYDTVVVGVDGVGYVWSFRGTYLHLFCGALILCYFIVVMMSVELFRMK